MHDELLTYKQAAERLNCSERTLRRMAAAGKIKSLVLGSHTIRFRLSDLERLIATFNMEDANGNQ